jgi:hypothetical protein
MSVQFKDAKRAHETFFEFCGRVGCDSEVLRGQVHVITNIERRRTAVFIKGFLHADLCFGCGVFAAAECCM